MKNRLKIIAAGTLGAIGFASAAIAQTNTQNPASPNGQPGRMMESGMMGHGKNMGMMMDPAMHKKMADMMNDCSKMMKKMAAMSDMKDMPRD